MGLLQTGIPCRYVIAIMSFFGMVFNYLLRININITIVAMVNYSAIERSEDSGRGIACGFNATEDELDPADDGPFAWNESTQATITSSFFWGYIITQIPGGRLSEIVGGKWIFFTAIVGTGILNIIFPFCASETPTALIVLRILMGLLEGPTFPVMHSILACWAPPEERSRIASIVYAGSQAGTLVAYPLSGLIAEKLGWESVFYIMGTASLVWGAAWVYLMHDSPVTHPRITVEERAYLLESIGATQQKKQPVPWKAMLTSMPFWAILIADIGNNWGFWMLLTEIPIYMKNILNYDLQDNGLVSALPYFCMWMFSLLYGALVDSTIKRGILSVKRVRRIATLNAHFVGALLLIGVAFTGCDETLTIVLLTAAAGVQGAIYSGFLTNHIDIAPNFAGTTYGITNCIAAIPSFVAPLTAGYITNGAQTLANWRKVFFIAAGFYATGSVFYAFFAEGTIQDWNYYGLEKEDLEKNGKPLSSDESTRKKSVVQ